MTELSRIITRRSLIRAGALGAGGLLLAGCDRLNSSAGFRGLLQGAADPRSEGRAVSE